jgi:hypothetical protein
MGATTKTFAFVKFANTRVRRVAWGGGAVSEGRAAAAAAATAAPLRPPPPRPRAPRPPRALRPPHAPLQQATAAIAALHETACPGGAGGAVEVKFADADAGDRNPQLSAPPSDNLYCKNLPPSFTDDELRGLFAPYGGVVECKLLHRGDGAQVGFG